MFTFFCCPDYVYTLQSVSKPCLHASLCCPDLSLFLCFQEVSAPPFLAFLHCSDLSQSLCYLECESPSFACFFLLS